MADDDLRALERAWQQSGSVEDEAAWLLQRVRSGELPRERLELAADLGDPASCAALQASGSFQPPDRSQFLVLLQALPPLEEGLRAALAMVRWLLSQSACNERSEWERELSQKASVALARAEAWVVRPCPEHEAAVLECTSWPAGIPPGWYGKSRHFHAALAMRDVVEFLRSREREQLQRALAWASLEGAFDALQGEVVPWVLLRSDPLQDRLRE